MTTDESGVPIRTFGEPASAFGELAQDLTRKVVLMADKIGTRAKPLGMLVGNFGGGGRSHSGVRWDRRHAHR